MDMLLQRALAGLLLLVMVCDVCLCQKNRSKFSSCVCLSYSVTLLKSLAPQALGHMPLQLPSPGLLSSRFVSTPIPITLEMLNVWRSLWVASRCPDC